MTGINFKSWLAEGPKTEAKSPEPNRQTALWMKAIEDLKGDVEGLRGALAKKTKDDQQKKKDEKEKEPVKDDKEKNGIEQPLSDTEPAKDNNDQKNSD